MARAQSSGGNRVDDIPLARRASPLRKPSRRELKLIALFSLLLAIFLVVFSFTVFSKFVKPGFVGGNVAPSADGRLLGHFPYQEVSKDSLIAVYPGLEIHRDTYEALRAMRSAAVSDGVNLVLLSGYRSIDLQKQIFYGRKSARNQIAIERAKVSAPPGYSEHSTGYAIDLGDATRRDTDLEVEFETTRAFRWLKENAARYHFVLSFPKGNPQKVSYEPWHWRFEGTVEALRLFETANEFRRAQGSFR